MRMRNILVYSSGQHISVVAVASIRVTVCYGETSKLNLQTGVFTLDRISQQLPQASLKICFSRSLAFPSLFSNAMLQSFTLNPKKSLFCNVLGGVSFLRAMTALMSLDAIIFQWSKEAKSSETVDDVPDIRKDSI